MYEFDKLYFGTFVKRYKRFLVDVELGDELITAYNPNTGSMKGLLTTGCEVALSLSSNVSRKYRYTIEGFKRGGYWVYTNTVNVNTVVENGIKAGECDEFKGFEYLTRELKVGNSRIDFYLRKKGLGECFIEVKNVTLLEDGIAKFPDAETVRGKKHLKVLSDLSRRGYNCFIFYVIGVDAKKFECAKNIDESYCKQYIEALKSGVKPIFYRSVFKPEKGFVYLEKM